MSSSRHTLHVLRPGEIAEEQRRAQPRSRLRPVLLAAATAFAAVFVVLAIEPRLPGRGAWLQAQLSLSRYWH
mgnify:CR=1 FL=1